MGTLAFLAVSFLVLYTSQSTWCLYLESSHWYLIPQSRIAPFPCLPWRCWLRRSMVPKSLGHLSQACLVSSWIFLCVSKVALERRTLLQPLVGHGNLPVVSVVCLQFVYIHLGWKLTGITAFQTVVVKFKVLFVMLASTIRCIVHLIKYKALETDLMIKL